MTQGIVDENLHRAAERAAELFTEIYEQLEQRPVCPNVTRDQMRDFFADSIGEQGVGLEQTLDEFHQQVLPNSMGTPHPMYFGLVNSSPLPAGPLADFLLSSLNNNGGSFHQSPAISSAEEEVVRQFAMLCGYPSDASGMILPGGTFANLQGLMLARQRHFPDWMADGPLAIDGQPLIYLSESAHFCNDRAAHVLGIGRSGLRSVPTRGRGEIDSNTLDALIRRDVESGNRPFAVVANAGTTGTGAIDALQAVADVCQRHEVWMHVDACYGGAALLLEPGIESLQAINRADSIAIDPHKWFFVPMTAGLLLTKHRQLELDTFDVSAPYIPDDGTVDAFRRGLPTSRRSSGLTVWMTLRAYGWSVIREAVARNIELVRLLEERLREHGFAVLDNGQLSVACARAEPPGMSESETDSLQQRIAATVIASGQAWFSTVKFKEKLWLRFNLVNLYTRQHHIDELADLVFQAADDNSPNQTS